MDERFQRFEQMLNSDQVERLQAARVAIVGLGGVGGTAVTCLARSGITTLLIVDFDIVELSNLNRQLLYCSNDIGEKKVTAASNHLRRINPNIDLTVRDAFIDDDSLQTIANWKPTHIIDAIDSISGKCALIKLALDSNIPFITSLGMGNRFHPEQVELTTLNKTNHDPLAKRLRSKLRQQQVDLEHVPVIYSNEEPLKISQPIGSYVAVTATAGLLLADFIIANILKR